MWFAPAFAAPLPACAGGVEISRAHVVRVEQNGVLVLSDGRALLLEAFRRRVAAGATRLGLGVSAEHAHALGLYLGIGLTIDREWRKYRPVRPTSGLAADAADTSGS